MTDDRPAAAPYALVALNAASDFEEMLAGFDRIIHDKELQQQLLDAGLLIRIEPDEDGAGAASTEATPRRDKVMYPKPGDRIDFLGLRASTEATERPDLPAASIAATLRAAPADLLSVLDGALIGECPTGCGCRIYSPDADPKDCGCDGICTATEWPDPLSVEALAEAWWVGIQHRNGLTEEQALRRWNDTEPDTRHMRGVYLDVAGVALARLRASSRGAPTDG